MEAVYASDEPAKSIVPNATRDLRACLSCQLVKTSHQWQQDGCENCGWTDGYQESTTNRFHGLIAMMSKDRSWVFKWQRMKPSYHLGCYAVKVEGYGAVAAEQDDDAALGGDDDAH